MGLALSGQGRTWYRTNQEVLMKSVMDSVRRVIQSLWRGHRESGRVTAEYAVGVVAVIGVGAVLWRMIIPIGPKYPPRWILDFVRWLIELIMTWMGW